MADTASASAATRAELEERFGVTMPSDLMAEALSILRLYGLTPADLFFKWEAFLLSSSKQQGDSGLPFNIDNLRELRKDIQLSATTSNVATIKREHNAFASGSTTSSPAAAAAGGGGPQASRIKKLGGRAALDSILDGAPSTPLNKRAKMAGGNNASTPASLTTPLARPTAGFGGAVGGAMRPTASPSTSHMTPQPLAHAKSAIPSHLSRSLVPDSPGTGNTSSFDSPSTPSSSSSSAVKFEDRPNALEVVETLNGHLQSLVGAATESSTSRIALASNANPKDYIYRYMFEKVSERATVLDNAIDEAADLVMQYYGIDDLGNPEHPSHDDIYCVGRICPEGDSVRLTETSLQFESSRRYGGGMRVPLRFDPDLVVRSSDDPSFSTGEGGVGLFPGMIIGVKGRNPGGGAFTVSEVLMLPPVDQPQSSVAELVDYQYGRAKLDGAPMSVVTACGPFTVDENLSYAPLTALVEELSNLRPDLVILLGPFVDASHPLIKSGDVDQTAHQLFQQVISPKISSLLDYSLNTTVILVPSVRDLISHNVVYPQAPLEREGLNLHKRAKLLPNPATFSVNEIVFAVTTADTLFSLKQNEYFKKAKDASASNLSSEPNGPDSQEMAAPKDAMARICRHILRQRSFYPLFPAPANPPLEPLNLDVTHSHLLRFNEGTGADVFILPSMLKHFSKIVDSAVVVNPASLTRKNQAGTFAKMIIYPTARHDLEQAGHSMDVDEEEDPASDHRVYERARVDIVRI